MGGRLFGGETDWLASQIFFMTGGWLTSILLIG